MTREGKPSPFPSNPEIATPFVTPEASIVILSVLEMTRGPSSSKAMKNTDGSIVIVSSSVFPLAWAMAWRRVHGVPASSPSSSRRKLTAETGLSATLAPSKMDKRKKFFMKISKS
jgi:hypothetical protein